MGGSLLASLNRVKHQAGILNVLARLSSEHEVGVKGGVPASQEAGLDLSVLSKTGLADLLLSQSILLQSSGKRVLTLGALREGLRAGQGSAGNGVVEGFGLGLCRRRGSQSCLRLSGRASLRQKLDLLVDGAAEIIEGLADVGRVVVGLVGVLGAARRFRWSVSVRRKAQFSTDSSWRYTHVTCNSFW